ncbi:hypothetical protein BH23VER1_BH23VER1_35480 [soil metagenome]
MLTYWEKLSALLPARKPSPEFKKTVLITDNYFQFQ